MSKNVNETVASRSATLAFTDEAAQKSIVVNPVFKGVKLYVINNNKKGDLREWCKQHVAKHLKEKENVNKGQFYTITHTDADGKELVLLVALHDKENSNWSGVKDIDKFNKGKNLVDIDGPFSEF